MQVFRADKFEEKKTTFFGEPEELQICMLYTRNNFKGMFCVAIQYSESSNFVSPSLMTIMGSPSDKLEVFIHSFYRL
jgi:hypothetical protein